MSSSATIWKYELDIVDEQIVTMPAGATILTAQWQHDKLCLWACVNPDLDRESRRIAILGTGHGVGRLGPAFNYIGTAQTPGGFLVWHIFEMIG